jgi:hypothetical protein
MSTQSESKALRLTTFATCFLRRSHHGVSSSSAVQASSCQPYLRRHLNHISQLITQATRRWSTDSGSWLQKAQEELLCRPCRCLLSAVQQRSWIASHMKKLNSLGALTFQTSLASNTADWPGTFFCRPTLRSNSRWSTSATRTCLASFDWVRPPGVALWEIGTASEPVLLAALQCFWSSRADGGPTPLSAFTGAGVAQLLPAPAISPGHWYHPTRDRSRIRKFYHHLGCSWLKSWTRLARFCPPGSAWQTKI